MRLDDELQFHIEEQTRLNIAKGMDPEEAAREARASLGSIAAIKDDVRDVHPLAFLDGIRQDLAYAVRTLAHSPAFALTAILSLALGIGVNAAVFSSIREILLKQLPVRDPQQLVRVEAGYGDWSYPILEDFARLQQNVFSSIFASTVSEVRVRSVERDLGPLRVSFTTPEYFTGLAPDLALGRAYEPAEQHQPLALIHFDVWDRDFQRDAAILGKPLQIGRQMFQIIGVTAPSFHGEQPNQRAAVWVPLPQMSAVMPTNEALWNDRRFFTLQPMARLNPGVTIQQADAHAKTIFPRVMELNDAALGRAHKPDPTLKVQVLPGSAGMAQLRDRYSKPLMLLQGAVVLVLAIACFNLANLLYVRGWARQRETAVRLAMGSHRGRLIRQLLVEGAVLSLAGAIPAYAIAAATLRLLSPFLLNGETIELDLPVLLAAILLATFAGVVTSISPALRATRVDINESLKSSTKTATANSSRRQSSRVLIASQVALSLTLAAASTMLLQNLRRIYSFDLGFERQNLLLTEINGSGIGLKTPEAQRAFHDRVLETTRAIPGVASASLSACGLLTDCAWGARVKVADKTPDPSVRPTSNLILATHTFTRNIGFPLLDGRHLAETDNAAGPPVVLVNQTFVDKFLPGERAVGRIVESEILRSKQATIVGVVRDAVYISINREHIPMIFVPFAQMPAPVGSLEIRTQAGADPAAVAPAIRRALAGIDPLLIVKGPKTTNEQLAGWISQQRLLARLCTIFAILALTLAAIGIYGVTAFGVSRRTSEIGIRVAFGADRASIRRLILSETGWVALAGLAAGIPLSAAAYKLLTAYLFRAQGFDYMSLAAAAAILAGIVVAAAWIPARRAAAIDPITALRYE